MGLGTWTTVEGIVYPSNTRYGGGFQWMVVDEDRTSTNTSKLRIRPYIKKRVSVNNDYAAFNTAYQASYFKINDADQKNILTRFDFRQANVGTAYPLSVDGYPFQTSASVEYVEYTIPHAADGSATVKVTGYIKGESSSNYFRYVSTTASITLPKMNRASVITVADERVAIGGYTTFYITKSDPTHLNTIIVSCHGISIVHPAYEVAYMRAETEITVPAMTMFYEETPSSASMEGVAICKTYDASGNYIGESTTTFELYVADKPSFNASIESSDTGVLIRNVSTVTASFSEIVNTPGASGTSTYAVLDGKRGIYANPAVFEKATGDEYTFRYIDPRGISASKVLSFNNVIDYFPPAIGNVSVTRDLESGELDVYVSGKWFGGAFTSSRVNNTAGVRATLTPRNGGDSLTESAEAGYNLTAEYSECDFSETLTFSGLNEQTDYTLTVVFYDEIYTADDETFPAVAYSTIIPRAKPTFMWNGETFRINGNLEVTGTYPGGGGGGGAYSPGTGIDISAAGVISVKDGTYFPYTGGNLNGVINILGGENPYVGLFDGVNYWYFQALQEDGQCGIGKTWTVSLKVDDSGNASVVGNLLVSGNTITNGTESVNISDIASKSEIEDMLTQINNALAGI